MRNILDLNYETRKSSTVRRRVQQVGFGTTKENAMRIDAAFVNGVAAMSLACEQIEQKSAEDALQSAFRQSSAI